MSKCKGCGAEIIWVRTPSGAMMPLDAKPEKRGVVQPAHPGPIVHIKDTYMPHWASCKHAKEFKK